MIMLPVPTCRRLSYRRVTAAVFVVVGVALASIAPAEAVNQTQVIHKKYPYFNLGYVREYRDLLDTVKQTLHSYQFGDNENGLKSADNTVEANADKHAISGVSSIIAVAKENVWPRLRVPGMGMNAADLRSQPNGFPSVVATLYKIGQNDFNTKVRNLIFSQRWVKVGLRLSNLRTELKQTYFDNGAKASAFINSRLRIRFDGNLPDLLDGPTPQNTEAVIVNVKETEGLWDGLTQFVGRIGNSNTDMFELRGVFDYRKADDGRSHVVHIPFRNTEARLKITIEGDHNATARRPAGQYLPPVQEASSTLLNSCALRLLLPITSHTSRTMLETGNDVCASSARAGYDDKCMELTQALTVSHFSPTGFKHTALTGAIVVSNDIVNRRSSNQYSSYNQFSKFDPSKMPYVSDLKSARSNLWRSPLFQIDSDTLNRYLAKYGETEQTIVANHGIRWEVESVI